MIKEMNIQNNAIPEGAACAPGFDALLGDEVERREDEAAHVLIDAKHPPLVALGSCSSSLKHVYYSRPHRRIYSLAPRNHCRRELLSMANLEDYAAWVMPDLENSREEVELNRRRIIQLAEEGLLRMTDGRIFDATAIRGRGIWRASDGLVYNTGAACYLFAGGRQGVIVDRVYGGNVYEPCAAQLPLPGSGGWSAGDGKALLELFSARSWSFTHAGELLLGWIAASILGGVVNFRPHAWITAPANSGKTALRDEIIACLGGSFVYSADGVASTPAALRRALNGEALPVICDEQDVNANDEGGMKRLDVKLELARISSLGGKVSVAGSGSGLTDDFHLRSCFLFLSIEKSLSRESDRSRWLDLRLLPLRSDSAALLQLEERQRAARELVASDLPGRLISRVVSQCGFIDGNIERLRAALRQNTASARCADMFAVLLSCSYAVIHGGEIDDAACDRGREIIAAYEKQAERVDEFDECVEALLDYCVSFEGVRWSVSRLCARYASLEDGAHRDDVKTALESLGVLYRPGERFCLRKTKRVFSTIFHNTEYAQRAQSVFTVGCGDAGENEHGVKITTARTSGGSSPVHVISFPVEMMEAYFLGQ